MQVMCSVFCCMDVMSCLSLCHQDGCISDCAGSRSRKHTKSVNGSHGIRMIEVKPSRSVKAWLPSFSYHAIRNESHEVIHNDRHNDAFNLTRNYIFWFSLAFSWLSGHILYSNDSSRWHEHAESKKIELIRPVASSHMSRRFSSPLCINNISVVSLLAWAMPLGYSKSLAMVGMSLAAAMLFICFLSARTGKRGKHFILVFFLHEVLHAFIQAWNMMTVDGKIQRMILPKIYK